MMLVKILKRKDASSLIVGIILAMIIVQALSITTGDLAAELSGIKDSQQGGFGFSPPGTGWEQTYLYPIVWALIQIVALEVLVALAVTFNILFKNTTTQKKRS